MRGKIKSWLTEKGFGFIKSDFGDADVFVHFSELRDVTDTHLPVGTEVDFEEVTTSDGRLQAKDVRVIAFPEDVPQEDRPPHAAASPPANERQEPGVSPREDAMGFLQGVVKDSTHDLDLRLRAASIILANTGQGRTIPS